MSSSVPTVGTSQKQPKLGALVTLFLAPAFIFANMYTTQAILPVLSLDFNISLYYFGGSFGAVLPGLARRSFALPWHGADRIDVRRITLSLSTLNTERWLLWLQTSIVLTATNLFLREHMLVPIVAHNYKFKISKAR